MAKATKKEVVGKTVSRQVRNRVITGLVGSRENAREREMELEQRKDQGGENQLGDL